MVLDDEQLDIARDWLVISLHTAQRVSDFLKFKVEDIIDIDGSKFIAFKQQKTKTPMYVLLREPVLNIIKNGKSLALEVYPEKSIYVKPNLGKINVPVFFIKTPINRGVFEEIFGETLKG